jgi:hypothetical protein
MVEGLGRDNEHQREETAHSVHATARSTSTSMVFR